MGKLSVSGLTFRYPNSRDWINFGDRIIEKGDHTVILGTSGKGKTTLLHLIAGMMQPGKGTVEIDKTALGALSAVDLDLFRAKNIGLVFQKPHLVSSLTVFQNLQLVPYFSKLNISDQEINGILARLDIVDTGQKKPTQISQGQAQRVVIARAVLHSPKLILADEPTASLDDENCERVINLLKEQAGRIGATLIIATHDQRVKTAIPSVWQL